MFAGSICARCQMSGRVRCTSSMALKWRRGGVGLRTAPIGWLCDHIGPRRAYTWLLVLGSIPVMAVGLAHDYTTFLLFRLAIGA